MKVLVWLMSSDVSCPWLFQVENTTCHRCIVSRVKYDVVIDIFFQMSRLVADVGTVSSN